MNQQLRLSILTALSQCGQFMLPEAALRSYVRVASYPEPSETETSSEIRRMEGEGLIVSARNPIGNLNWKLTAAGTAAAAELKL